MTPTEPNNELELDDAIVLLLGASTSDPRLDGRIEGVTRLEKLVFLLERETHAKNWLQEDADFKAHNFGPFSAKVYQAVDLLSAAGILTDSRSLANDTEDSWETTNLIDDFTIDNVAPEPSDPYQTRDFELTERGWKYFRVLASELNPEAMSELSAFKARFAPLPLRQLVRYVYQRYDDFTQKSLIRDQVLGPNG